MGCSALQISVRQRMAQDAAHGGNLAFMMESVSADVLQNKCRTTRRADPFFWNCLQCGIELKLAQIT
jgi:hypothetical protein